jgi:hypothetical protein
MEQRKTYETPTLVELGTVEELTLGQSHGHRIDRDFPANTDFDDLTFS